MNYTITEPLDQGKNRSVTDPELEALMEQVVAAGIYPRVIVDTRDEYKTVYLIVWSET